MSVIKQLLEELSADKCTKIGVSRVLTASILSREDGGSVFLRKVNIYLHVRKA